MTTPAPAAAPSAPAAAPSSPAPSAPSAGATGAAPAAPVTTKAPPTTDPGLSSKRQYKGKVDKEERVWELSDEEVSVRLQKSEAAERRMQQASEIQKKWNQLQQAAKEDPSVLFRELLGQDPLDWAQKQVEEKWKLEVMPEHERKVYELERKIQAYQAQEQKRLAAETQTRQQRESAAMEAQLESDFKRAFELSQLEYTPDNLEVFGKLVLAAHDNNLEYTPAQLAAEARAIVADQDRKYEEKVKGRFGGLKGSDLLSYLGDATVKEVLKAAVAKHAGSLTPAPATVPAPAGIPANTHPRSITRDRDEQGKFLTTRQWRDSFKGKR